MKFEIAESAKQHEEKPIKVWLETDADGTVFLVANGAKLLYFDGIRKKLTTWSFDWRQIRAMGFDYTNDGCVRVD